MLMRRAVQSILHSIAFLCLPAIANAVPSTASIEASVLVTLTLEGGTVTVVNQPEFYFPLPSVTIGSFPPNTGFATASGSIGSGDDDCANETFCTISASGIATAGAVDGVVDLSAGMRRYEIEIDVPVAGELILMSTLTLAIDETEGDGLGPFSNASFITSPYAIGVVEFSVTEFTGPGLTNSAVIPLTAGSHVLIWDGIAVRAQASQRATTSVAEPAPLALLGLGVLGLGLASRRKA